MPDDHYPSVDIDFILEHVKSSRKLEHDGIVNFGATTTLVIAGPQAIYKRSILVRELSPGQVCLEQATGLAIKFSFLGPLMAWLEVNRDWKEGAYIVPQNKNTNS